MAVGEGALTVDGYPEYGFCSEHCRKAFLAEPARYAVKPTEKGEPGEHDHHHTH